MLQMHMVRWDLKNEPVQSSTMRRLSFPEREDLRNDEGKEKKQKAQNPRKKKNKKRDGISLWNESKGQIFQSIMVFKSCKCFLEGQGRGCCTGLSKILNTLLILEFLLTDGIAGLRLLLSTAPASSATVQRQKRLRGEDA